ncbi:hypothetical protein PQX77_017727 [Marasmius sp. AFHP31]|nr:hypothetical protein PQX77_017727 [Marasmius sp. AFHP31]
MKPATPSNYRMPKLVVFDLDYTLWDMWIDTHVTGPLHREKNTQNEILDKHNQTISFYNHVPQILHRLRKEGVMIAVASRTSAPTLARQALQLLLVPPPPKSDERAQKALALDWYPPSTDDQIHSGPLHREKNTQNEILDKHNQTISFYNHVPQILHRLRKEGVMIAVASRTSAPTLARQALQLLLVPPPPKSDERAQKAIDFFDQLEIYPGSKLTHFKRIHEKTGIPYEEMVFFDDEYRNSETQQLGVTFCLVKRQMDNDTFEKGLAEWRKRHPLPSADEEE